MISCGTISWSWAVASASLGHCLPHTVPLSDTHVLTQSVLLAPQSIQGFDSTLCKHKELKDIFMIQINLFRFGGVESACE